MSTDSLQGRSALVTGGAHGIGRAICRVLAREGARVAVNYQNNEKAALEPVELLGRSAERSIVVQTDVSQERDVFRMVDRVRSGITTRYG